MVHPSGAQNARLNTGLREDGTPNGRSSTRAADENPDAVSFRRLATRELRILTWLGITVVTAAFLFVMYYARAVAIPLVVAVMVAFLLRPIQRVLSRVHCPPWLSAAVLILASFLLVAILASALAGPASRWMDRLPESARMLEQRLRVFRTPLQEISAAGERVQRATDIGADGDQPVEVRITAPSLAASLLSMTSQALGTLVVTVVLVYFLLASDQRFLRKLVELAPRIQDKKRVVETLRGIELDVSRYLLSITMINVALGAVIGIGLWLLGMPNPVLWGVMAAALNFVPYLGAVIGASVVGLASFVTFESIGSATLPPVFYVACSALEGQVITPMILGLRLNLDPLVVFLSLLAWGWLWGVPGAILAVPILATIKILCDHVDRLHAVATFLSK